MNGITPKEAIANLNHLYGMVAPDIQRSLDVAFKCMEEEPQGEWIELLRGIHVTDYKCSCCGRTVRDDTGYDVSKDYPFCHCGADMRGGAE